MTLSKTTLTYSDNNTYHGLFVNNSAKPTSATILIVHTWNGRGQFVEDIAEKLAALGYNAFAVDMYGDGIYEKHPTKCEALMKPLVQDRAELQKRINLALDFVKTLEQVDAQKIIAIGYCFGGLCVLDLARSNADLLGVVSFHGLLHAPQNPSTGIKAKVLVLHGHDDPMVPVSQVNALKNELTELKADWQLHAYGATVHAFTNKQAKLAGTAEYNASSDKRSWQSMLNFFDELL
jgi:dienelactone hydrolase